MRRVGVISHDLEVFLCSIIRHDVTALLDTDVQ